MVALAVFRVQVGSDSGHRQKRPSGDGMLELVLDTTEFTDR